MCQQDVGDLRSWTQPFDADYGTELATEGMREMVGIGEEGKVTCSLISWSHPYQSVSCTHIPQSLIVERHVNIRPCSIWMYEGIITS